MRLSRMSCDGCGRGPSFVEWCRGELTNEGYGDWRHPGIVFKQHGIPLDYQNRRKCERLFYALFGRKLPDEADYLCPDCQRRADEELPDLIARDPGDPPDSGPSRYLG